MIAGIGGVILFWSVIQVLNNIEAPGWIFQVIMLLLGIGLPLALFFAWAFEMTPEGIKKEAEVDRDESITPKTGRKLDYAIIISLGLSLGYFIWESRFEQKTSELESAPIPASVEYAAPEVPAPPPEYPAGDIDKNSIAVLPFANRSADTEDITIVTAFGDLASSFHRP